MTYREIIRLVWPLALGMLNNAVLQFVDRAFLSKESMESIEAVLPASMLAWIVIGFFQSVVAYSGTFVAQFHGAGDARGAAMAYRAGTFIALVSGALSIAAVPLGMMVIPLVSGNPEVVARAKTYYTIVSCGAVALCGQMAAASYFTGRGLTRLVFWVNLGGNILNIILDPLLIFTFGLGIAGAAYATVIAMFAQWAVLALSAKGQGTRVKGQGTRVKGQGEDGKMSKIEGRNDSAEPLDPWPLALDPSPSALDPWPSALGPSPSALDPSPSALVWKILRFGVPSGAYSVLNVLSFTIFVFVTGRVGDVAFAVSNACFSVNWLLIAPMEGFAVGAATLVAQAQGRGDSEAAKTALRKTLALALGVVIALSVAAVVFNRPLLSLFAPDAAAAGEEFYSLGFVLIVLMAAWQVFDASDVVISGALKGAGDTKFVMWWMVAVAFGFWLPLVWIVKIFNNTMPALWGTMIAYVVVICAGEIIRWRKGKWKEIKLV